MEDVSLYLWLFAGFAIGFLITAMGIIWFFRRRAQGTCAPHEWETGPDGRLRCSRCGFVAGKRD